MNDYELNFKLNEMQRQTGNALEEIAQNAIRQTSAVARALIAKGHLEPADVERELGQVRARIHADTDLGSSRMDAEFLRLIHPEKPGNG